MKKSASARVRALKRAERYVGVKEHPPGSNRGTLIDRWNLAACGLTGVYWCASFVHGMFKEIGVTLPGGASVQSVRTWARSVGDIVKRPRRADLACFEFGEGAYDYGDHIGIVERVLALRWGGGKFTGWIQTIEGNTQSSNAGVQSNGGGVFRRRRWVRGIGAQFVRVKD